MSKLTSFSVNTSLLSPRSFLFILSFFFPFSVFNFVCFFIFACFISFNPPPSSVRHSLHSYPRPRGENAHLGTPPRRAPSVCVSVSEGPRGGGVPACLCSLSVREEGREPTVGTERRSERSFLSQAFAQTSHSMRKDSSADRH